MTMNEYANVQLYKYLFQAQAIKSHLKEKKLMYSHRDVSLFQSALNLLTFFCSCSRKSSRQ